MGDVDMIDIVEMNIILQIQSSFLVVACASHCLVTRYILFLLLNIYYLNMLLTKKLIPQKISELLNCIKCIDLTQLDYSFLSPLITLYESEADNQVEQVSLLLLRCAQLRVPPLPPSFLSPTTSTLCTSINPSIQPFILSIVREITRGFYFSDAFSTPAFGPQPIACHGRVYCSTA